LFDGHFAESWAFDLKKVFFQGATIFPIRLKFVVILRHYLIFGHGASIGFLPGLEAFDSKKIFFQGAAILIT
jgi:hypothetical protein